METAVNGEPVPVTTGGAVRWEDTPNRHGYCDAEIGRLRERIDRAEAKLAEYENAITWNTSCTGCAAKLDADYAETVRREQAEEKLAQVRDLASRWVESGQRPPGERTGVVSATSAECGRQVLAITGEPE